MTNALRRDKRRIRKHAIERAREARRTIARERDYHCSSCDFERRSWLALHSCPSCGTGFAARSAGQGREDDALLL